MLRDLLTFPQVCKSSVATDESCERRVTCLSFVSGIASDGLKGRVFEVSLADLQNDEVAFRKFKLITEDVQGKNCLTNFHGMDLTRDKMCSMVKKWQVGRGTFTPALILLYRVRRNTARE